MDRAAKFPIAALAALALRIDPRLSHLTTAMTKRIWRGANIMIRLAAASALLVLMIPLAAAAAPMDAGGAEVQPDRTIEVSGNGESHAIPDVANLELAIETNAPTAEQAANRNAALAQKVVDALKAKLGDKGKIHTGGYSLNPQYNEQSHGEKPRIVSYTAQNTITAETGAMDLVGPMIDSAIAAGANRVNSLNFSLKDDTKARIEAIGIASRDAQAQAQALAAALGVKLKRVAKASTMAQGVRPIPMMMGAYSMHRMEAAPTPIEANDVTVNATVSLTYEIE